MVRTIAQTAVRVTWGLNRAATAAIMLLLCCLGDPAGAQEPPKGRARTFLNQGIYHSKRGEYDSAAKALAQAQAGKTDLNASEQRDLAKWVEQNNQALEQQVAGANLLRNARALLDIGNAAEAGKLLRAASTNSYLSPVDKEALRDLNKQLASVSKSAADEAKMMSEPGSKDLKALLTASRAALARGELDLAEAMCTQAEKAGGSWLSWPWSDTPTKVRRDITSARAKLNTPAPKVEVVIEKKDSGGGFRIWPFGGKKEEKPVITPKDFTPKDTPAIVKGTEKPGPKEVWPKEGPEIRHTAGSTPRPDFPPRAPDIAPLATGNKARAIKLVEEGEAALKKNDFALAQKLALEAKALKAELSWYDPNPDRLLSDIAARSAAVTVASPGLPPKSGKGTPQDARALVKEGRKLLGEDRVEEAEKLMLQAQGISGVRYGLFEDNPDKLHADIKKLRTRRDREEASKLTAEARTLYQAGNYHEARLKALQAQKLHGRYSTWDLGDRADKLLQEINRAEMKLKRPTIVDPLKDPGSSARPGPIDFKSIAKGPDGKAIDPKGYTPKGITPKGTSPMVADLTPRKSDGAVIPPGGGPKGALPASIASAERQKAAQLLAEARGLMKKGQLVEARGKAQEARAVGIVFGPEEDSPEACLLHINIQCDQFVQGYIKRSIETVRNNPADPDRFRKAQADLDAARQLATTFGHDLKNINQNLTFLHQAASAAGAPAVPTPPGVEPKGDALAQAGREKLDKARLELRAGHTNTARRLAEEAYNPTYGIQAEALAVLRSIDAEEGNQIRLTAERNAKAGIDAFLNKDYRLAQSLFLSLDTKMLTPDLFGRVRDILSAPEMAGTTEPRPLDPTVKGGPDEKGLKIVDPAVKVATATDRDPGDPFRAMEKIQFQQMRERMLDTLKHSHDLVSRGMHDKAIDMLNDYLETVKASGLDAELSAGLKRQVDFRLQQYRTLAAQERIEKHIPKVGPQHNEGERTAKISRQQHEVAEKIKTAGQLMKEGKLKDALAYYKQARALDPDNVAAQAGEHIVELRIRLERWEKDKALDESGFLKELDPHIRTWPSMAKPVIEDLDNPKKKGANKSFAAGRRTPFQKMVEDKLNQQINVKFVNTPLDKVLDMLRTETNGVNIIPDSKALTEDGIGLEQPISHNFENLSLKSALNIILRQANLTYVVKEDYISITTPRHAAAKMKQVVYPVADLVIPVDNYPTSPVNSFHDTMARHIAGKVGLVQAPTPFMPSTGLPPAPPVGSYAGGLGSAFAASGAPAPGTGGGNGFNVSKGQSHTIEDLLINLIQNTVASDTWQSMGGQGTVQYYPLGMALVINQQADVQEQVLDLLDALRRLQDLEVAIEMKLVNVSEAFFERLGLDFDVNFRTGTSRREPDLLTSNFTPFGFVNRNNDRLGIVSGLTPAGTLTPDLNIPLRSSSFDFSVPPFGGYPGTLGQTGGLSLGLAFLSDIQVFMFMEAAQGDRRTQVMQAPKITVFNGQTANISVQDQQFFLTDVSLAQAGAQTFFIPNNQPFQLGVNLQVTPVVSADRRFVRLNLTPQMTNLASATVPLIPIQIPVPQVFEGPGAGTTTTGQPVIFQMFFQQPTFSQIAVNTTVNVPDGGTVLLGGLKTMSEARNEFGPPILSKIPYLNRLFKNVGYGREVSSLMIMVTPRIIINEEEEAIFRGELDPIIRE